MKFTKQEIVAPGEIQKALEAEIKKHGTETDAAKSFGVTQPEFSRGRTGASMPPRKVLEKMDLEVKRFIVRKEK